MGTIPGTTGGYVALGASPAPGVQATPTAATPPAVTGGGTTSTSYAPFPAPTNGPSPYPRAIAETTGMTQSQWRQHERQQRASYWSQTQVAMRLDPGTGQPALFRAQFDPRSGTLTLTRHATAPDGSQIVTRYDERESGAVDVTVRQTVKGQTSEGAGEDGKTMRLVQDQQQIIRESYTPTGLLTEREVIGRANGTRVEGDERSKFATDQQQLTRYDRHGNIVDQRASQEQRTTDADGKTTVTTDENRIYNDGKAALSSAGRVFDGTQLTGTQKTADPRGGLDDEHEGTTTIRYNATADGAGGLAFGTQDLHTVETGGDDDVREQKFHVKVDPQTGAPVGEPDRYFEHTDQEWYEDLRDTVRKAAPIASIAAIAGGAILAPFTGGASLVGGIALSGGISAAGAVAEGSALLADRKDASWLAFGLNTLGAATGLAAVPKAVAAFAPAVQAAAGASGVAGTTSTFVQTLRAGGAAAQAAQGAGGAAGSFAAKNGGFIVRNLAKLGPRFPAFGHGLDALYAGVANVRTIPGWSRGFAGNGLAGNALKVARHAQLPGWMIGSMVDPALRARAANPLTPLDRYIMGTGSWIGSGGLAGLISLGLWTGGSQLAMRHLMPHAMPGVTAPGAAQSAAAASPPTAPGPAGMM